MTLLSFRNHFKCLHEISIGYYDSLCQLKSYVDISFTMNITVYYFYLKIHFLDALKRLCLLEI